MTETDQLRSKTAAESRISSHLEDASERLVEISTRNRFVHVNRKPKPANAMSAINQRSENLFTYCVEKAAKCDF